MPLYMAAKISMIVGGVGGTRCDETSRAKEKRIREEVNGWEKKKIRL